MSKRDSLPYLEFYPGDWKKDPGVQAQDFFTRHVWFELLLLMHESTERGVLLLNGKPMTYFAVAKNLGIEQQSFEFAIKKLLDDGVASQREDGAIFSRRMVRDEDIRKKRALAGQKGGKATAAAAKEQQTPSKVSTKGEAKEQQIPEDDIDIENDNEDLKIKGEADPPPTVEPDPFPWVETVPIPRIFDPDRARRAIRAWAKHAEMAEPSIKFNEFQAEALMHEAAENPPEKFFKAVRLAIRSGWRNIKFEAVPDPQSNAPPRKQTPTERTLEAAANVQRMLDNRGKLRIES